MASFDKETCIKYITYCINLTKKIIEFTNDEINKSTFLNNKLEQNLAIIKNDQKTLMEEINKNSSLDNEQNTEIKKINEKIELINEDVDEEIKKDDTREPIGRNVASIKRGGSAINKKNVEDSDEDEEDDDEEDEEDDDEDEDGEDTPLSRESDEEQIVGASNLPKQIIMK